MKHCVFDIPENMYWGNEINDYASMGNLTVSPDDKYIASTGRYGKVYIWKIRSPGAPISMLSVKSKCNTRFTDISWCPEDNLKVNT